MISDERTLTRDVNGTIVPYGDQVVIPEGTTVMITHRLGGNFTVTWTGGMAQIRGAEADALGEEIPAGAAAPTTKVHPARKPFGARSNKSTIPKSRSTSSIWASFTRWKSSPTRPPKPLMSKSI